MPLAQLMTSSHDCLSKSYDYPDVLKEKMFLIIMREESEHKHDEAKNSSFSNQYEKEDAFILGINSPSTWLR